MLNLNRMNPDKIPIYTGMVLILLAILSTTPGFTTQEARKFEVVKVENYTTFIASNWSLISTPLQLLNESVKAFLRSTDNNWSEIRTYSNYDKGWVSAVRGAPESTWFLHSVNHHTAYWVKMSDNSTLMAKGINYYKRIEIPLYTAWNIIGYPRNISKNIDLALSSITGNWESIWKYNNPPYVNPSTHATYTWVSITPTMHEIFRKAQNFTNMTSGSGYEIKLTTDDTLVFESQE